jgi:hypothetical protein
MHCLGGTGATAALAKLSRPGWICARERTSSRVHRRCRPPRYVLVSKSMYCQRPLFSTEACLGIRKREGFTPL